MLSVYSNNIAPNYNIAPVKNNKQSALSNIVTNTYVSAPSFKGASAAYNSVRTTLSTKEEKREYKHLAKFLDKESRMTLEMVLKNGTLLKSGANDNSTALDNLYKMATTPRADGMRADVLVKHTLNAIADPHIITQHFGDIPTENKSQVIDCLTDSKNLIDRKMIDIELSELFSGCCVAASEEFNLASKNPAEFTRFAEGLTSPKMAVEKEIKLDSLSEKTLDAIWLLNSFEIPYEAKDFKTAKITLAPDKNAFIREQIQETNQDIIERSPIDVLMQSTFMNVASQQTYNSLNDKRAGKFSNDDKGLIDFEKTFLESVVEDKNITSVTYQKVDENQRVVGYEADYNTVKQQLLETLEQGHNIIIGYTMTDENNNIQGGHEITIIGTKTDQYGELSFICNDTDDDNPFPIEYPASYLIPKIHHAGIPTEIAEKNMQQIDNWVLGIREFNNSAA
ncbi:MAG: hypothetical protein NC200_03650 [Candidatus Gastranaerophilales bacterium]|nr:hypothetical protein [Candidatus Gastranaerophilales bacterium]